MTGVNGDPAIKSVVAAHKYEGGQLMRWQQMVVLIAQDMMKRLELVILVVVLVS